MDGNSTDNLEDIALSDLTKPQTLVKEKFCNSLCKFIVEIQKVKGGDYPPQTVQALILAIQMHLKTCRVNWRLLNKDDPIFVDLFNIADNVMKPHTEMGLGVVNPLQITWKKICGIQVLLGNIPQLNYWIQSCI